MANLSCFNKPTGGDVVQQEDATCNLQSVQQSNCITNKAFNMRSLCHSVSQSVVLFIHLTKSIHSLCVLKSCYFVRRALSNCPCKAFIAVSACCYLLMSQWHSTMHFLVSTKQLSSKSQKCISKNKCKDVHATRWKAIIVTVEGNFRQNTRKDLFEQMIVE